MDTIVDAALGSGIPYITYAVPFFFLLIGGELLLARVQGKRLYRLADSIADLGCGVLQQVVGIFTRGLTAAGYVFLWSRLALVDVAALGTGAKFAAAAALFVGVDFLYYWFHRASHEIAFLWAAHSVHHQSEEYNLTVALRQSTFQGWFSWIFYLPLAVVGFPPAWAGAILAWNTLYQFWVHTCTIDRLGPLEWFLCTPSHHRVHHARNARYLDRNHGGVLIVWDRLFGTFVAEDDDEPVVYGTLRPVASWNPVWANLAEWATLFDRARRCERLVDAIGVFVRGPGWRPPGTPSGPLPEPGPKYDGRPPGDLDRYALLHFVVVLGAAVGLLVVGTSLPTTVLTAAALWVAAGLAGLGTLLDGRRIGWWIEALRLPAGVALLATTVPSTPVVAAAAAATLGSWYWLASRRPPSTAPGANAA